MPYRRRRTRRFRRVNLRRAIQRQIYRNTETKIYTDNDTAECNSSGVIEHLTSISQGSGMVNRLGDSIRVTGLHIRMKFYRSDATPATSILAKALVVKAHGRTITTADFSTTSDVLAYQNPRIFKTLRCIKGAVCHDQKGLINEVTSETDPKTDLFLENVYIKFRKPLVVKFNTDGSAATNYNGLYLYLYSPEGPVGGSNYPPTCQYSWNVYFKDA